MANLSAEIKKKEINFDMKSFYIWLHDRYEPDHVYIFTGFLEKYIQEYEANKLFGYEYIFKEAVYNKDEQKIKANCDVDIAIQGTCNTLQDKLHLAVLVTSDGDFASLIKFWHQYNIKTYVISPAEPDRCSYLLKRITAVIFMNQVIQRFIKNVDNEKALNEDET